MTEIAESFQQLINNSDKSKSLLWQCKVVILSRSVQSLNRIQLFRLHGLQHARPPCPSPAPSVYSNKCPLSWWCHPTISSYWAPSHLESSSFIVLSFRLFILFKGFSRQEYWSGLPFPSPVDVLSELSIMTHLSWVALHDVAPSFIKLDKAVVHLIRLVSFLWLWFSVWLFCEWMIDSYWFTMNEWFIHW